MICYICQRELERKEVIRGVKDCDTKECKNIVGYWHRACKRCSVKYNECEVCRADLTSVEDKRRDRHEGN